MLLRRFQAYRELEKRVEVAEAARIRTEDENRQLVARIEQAEERAYQDREEALRCRERVADWLAKRSGLGTIFGDMDSIPDVPRPDMTPAATGRQQARAFVEEAERQFNEDLRKYASANGPGH